MPVSNTYGLKARRSSEYKQSVLIPLHHTKALLTPVLATVLSIEKVLSKLCQMLTLLVELLVASDGLRSHTMFLQGHERDGRTNNLDMSGNLSPVSFLRCCRLSLLCLRVRCVLCGPLPPSQSLRGCSLHCLIKIPCFSVESGERCLASNNNC